MATRHTRSPSVALIALLLFVGGLGAACSRAAESSCGDGVVTDWSDGRIDGVYPLHCYENAADDLPEDVRAYSSAADDISRALQAQVRAEADDEPGSRARAVAPFSPATGSSSQSPPLTHAVLAVSTGLLVVSALAVSVWAARRNRGSS